LTAEFGLGIAPGQYAESEPPTGNEYVPPPLVNEYYYDEGPPVVTYYPPPWDYSYLYAWVPYPFLCSGFFFPGFFILNDFHIHHGHHPHGPHPHGHDLISNHFIDPRTHASFRVDPTMGTRGTAATRPPAGKVSRGLAYRGARVSATSIFKRSANGKTLSQRGNTDRQYRSFQNSSASSGRSFTRSFSSSSSRSYSALSTDGGGSFGGFRGGGYSGSSTGGGGFGGPAGGGHGGGHR